MSRGGMDLKEKSASLLRRLRLLPPACGSRPRNKNILAAAAESDGVLRMTKPELSFPSSLLSALREARRVVAITGAGISAESGVPTFRDAQTGLWARFKPEELATPEAFRRNPRLVWEWYEWRRQLVGSVQPNPGHLALAAIERRVPDF